MSRKLSRGAQVAILLAVIFVVPLYGDIVGITTGVQIESLTLGIAGGAIVALLNRILDWFGQ